MGCYVGSMTEDPVVLVRIYGQMTELFLDREKELEMFQVLHTHGCGPELFCSFSNGICYEFIRGVVLDDTLLRQPSVYRSQNTRLVHTLKTMPGNERHMNSQSFLLSIIDQSTLDLYRGYIIRIYLYLVIYFNCILEC